MSPSLGNPKIMMFYLALLPAIIDLGAVTLLGWAELTRPSVVVAIVSPGARSLALEEANAPCGSPTAVPP